MIKQNHDIFLDVLFSYVYEVIEVKYKDLNSKRDALFFAFLLIKVVLQFLMRYAQNSLTKQLHIKNRRSNIHSIDQTWLITSYWFYDLKNLRL